MADDIYMRGEEVHTRKTKYCNKNVSLILQSHGERKNMRRMRKRRTYHARMGRAGEEAAIIGNDFLSL